MWWWKKPMEWGSYMSNVIDYGVKNVKNVRRGRGKGRERRREGQKWLTGGQRLSKHVKKWLIMPQNCYPLSTVGAISLKSSLFDNWLSGFSGYGGVCCWCSRCPATLFFLPDTLWRFLAVLRYLPLWIWQLIR